MGPNILLADDSRTLKAIIARVFREVMQKQVFLFPEPMDAAAFTADTGAYMISSMTFRGVERGGLMLAVPEEMALEIAANFLGLEADDPFVEESRRDSLGEILNFTCCHMLTALYGDAESFDLSSPHPLSLSASETAILARKAGCMTFSVDNYQVVLQACFLTRRVGERSDAVR